MNFSGVNFFVVKYKHFYKLKRREIEKGREKKVLKMERGKAKWINRKRERDR